MVTMLPKDNMQLHHVQQLDLNLTQKISQSSSSDPIISKALVAIHDENIDPWSPQTTKEDWKFKEGKLYFKHCLYSDLKNCCNVWLFWSV